MAIDQEWERYWRAFVEQRGGKIRRFYRATSTHAVIALDQAVIKIATDQGVRLRLRAQAEAERFFRRVSNQVYIPPAGYREHETFGLLTMTPVEGVKLCESVQGGPSRMISGEVYRRLAGFVLNLCQLRESEPCSSWLWDYSMCHLSDKVLRDRLLANAATAVHRGLLTSDLVAALIELYDALPMVREPNHHDVAPWNVLLRPDGSVALLDAEFARYGFQGYDLIYLPMQWSLNAWFPSESRAWIQAVNELGGSDWFARMLPLLQKAMIYRLAAMSSELRTDAAALTRYRCFAERLVENDVDRQYRMLMGWERASML